MSINSYAQLPSEYAKEPETQQTYIEELYEESEKAIRAREWDTALTKLQLLNIRYPNNVHIEEAKLSIAFCYKEKKEYPRALTLINEFIEDHAQSKFLEPALQMKSEIENKNSSSHASSNNAGWALVGKVLAGIIGINIFFGLLLR